MTNAAASAADRTAPTDEALHPGPAERPSRWKGAALLLAGAAALVVVFAPVAPGLSPAGQRAAALFLLAIILWATEAIPAAVTALLVVALQPVFNVQPLRAAISAFASPVLFFVLATFVLAEAMMRTGLAQRFAYFVLARAGESSRRLVLAFMLGTAAISTIMSDVPACAIFMSIALGVFDQLGVKPGASRLGKAIMIGIPFASLIGGVATPAGSSINILGIYLIEQYGQVRISFLAWTAIGLPMVIVLVPIAWWALVRVYPPEPELVVPARRIAEDRARLGPMSRAERKLGALMALMIGLWIASTWVKALDVTLIALLGAVVMFLPGLRLVTWEGVERSVGWAALLMIGGVTSLGEASVKTGLAAWLVDGSLSGLGGFSALVLVAAISLFTVVIHLPLPIGPVVNAVLIPPVVLLAQRSGASPALYALPVAFTASCAFLLPLETTSLVTFAKGYYRMFDMWRPGVVVSLAWVVWMTVLMGTVGRWLGFL